MHSNSFHKLWEDLNGDASEAGLDDETRSFVERGLQIRPDRGEGDTFWDDFMLIFGNNMSAAASFLGVSVSCLSRWPGKIKSALEQIRKENKPKERSDMTHTG